MKKRSKLNILLKRNFRLISAAIIVGGMALVGSYYLLNSLADSSNVRLVEPSQPVIPYAPAGTVLTQSFDVNLQCVTDGRCPVTASSPSDTNWITVAITYKRNEIEPVFGDAAGVPGRRFVFSCDQTYAMCWNSTQGIHDLMWDLAPDESTGGDPRALTLCFSFYKSLQPQYYPTSRIHIFDFYYRVKTNATYSINYVQKWGTGTCESPFGTDSGGSGSISSQAQEGSGTGNGDTGKAKAKGRAGSKGGSSATNPSDKPDVIPTTAPQGDSDAKKNNEPSPFFDGKQYSPGSDESWGEGSTLATSARKAVTSWPFGAGLLILVAFGILGLRLWYKNGALLTRARRRK